MKDNKKKSVSPTNFVKLIFKDSFVYGAAGILSKSLVILTFPLLARSYSIEDYGIIDLLYFMTNLLTTFFIFGQDSAIFRFFHIDNCNLKRSKMITGSADTSQLGGPIRIAKITGQVAEYGIIPFISIMAYISISLGLINLFPIPLLDGGHLMFYGFEKILGRPLSQKTQEGFFRIGMFLLLFLMFFATFNDLRDLGIF